MQSIFGISGRLLWLGFRNNLFHLQLKSSVTSSYLASLPLPGHRLVAIPVTSSHCLQTLQESLISLAFISTISFPRQKLNMRESMDLISPVTIFLLLLTTLMPSFGSMVVSMQGKKAFYGISLWWLRTALSWEGLTVWVVLCTFQNTGHLL